MIIFYNQQRASLVVGTSKQVFPPQSLEARQNGDEITIWPPDQLAPVFRDPYTEIQDELGNGFADVDAAMTYLNAEFAKSTIETPADISDAIAALDAAIS